MQVARMQYHAQIFGMTAGGKRLCDLQWRESLYKI